MMLKLWEKEVYKFVLLQKVMCPAGVTIGGVNSKSLTLKRTKV